MSGKRKEIPIAFVMYTYVGSDKSFNDFLKNVVRDYLKIDACAVIPQGKNVQKVESENQQSIAIAIQNGLWYGVP